MNAVSYLGTVRCRLCRLAFAWRHSVVVGCLNPGKCYDDHLEDGR